MSENWIRIKEAATMCGVSTVTLQAMCRDGVLAHKKTSHLYLVSLRDVKKYKKSIDSITESTQDIRTYEENIKRLRNEKEEAEARMIADLKLLSVYPKRIECLIVMFRSMVCDMMEYGYLDITKREFDITMECLACREISSVADKYGLTYAGVRGILDRCMLHIRLRIGKMINDGSEVVALREEVDRLRGIVESMPGVVKDENSVYLDEVSLSVLNTRLIDLDFSVRALNNAASHGLETLRDLAKMSKETLFKWRNVGKKTVVEYGEMLSRHGLRHGMTDEELKEYCIIINQ